MNRTVLLVVVSLAFCAPAVCGSSMVPVPSVSWDELIPYVEANLRVEYRNGEVTVGASGEPFERQLFEPFDETLGEFATVLLVEGVTRRDVSRAVEAATRSLKESGFDASTASRDDLAARLWSTLRSDARFVGGLEKLFADATAKGQLKCSICDQGFAPKYLVPSTE